SSVNELNIPGIKDVEESYVQNSSSTQSINTEVRFYSPLVRNIAQQEGISQQEMDLIVGTGDQGRVTKSDIINYLETRKSNTTTINVTTEAPVITNSVPNIPNKVVKNLGDDEIIE